MLRSVNWKSPILWLLAGFLLSAAFTTFGPEEATLGANVRVVYLHGAWVWTSLAAFLAAALVGGVALILRRQHLHAWSRALGLTGLFFWITYLPISLWAMQANWNGLFLAEPRWRFAMVFAITGILLQLGLSFFPVIWTSLGNIAYLVALFISLQSAENVMHPPGPMLESDFGLIQVFFATLTMLLLLTAFQFTRWMMELGYKRRNGVD
jgi:hypothetical protein